MSLATILIVPGACQTSDFYQSFAQSLHNEGFPVVIVSIPSVGASPGLDTFAKDVDEIKKAIVKLTEQKRDILLVMHSYGGIPGSAAAQGFSTVERKKAGTDGGITRLVYIASYVLREGETVPGKGDYEGLKAYAVLDEEVSRPCEEDCYRLLRDAKLTGNDHSIPQ